MLPPNKNLTLRDVHTQNIVHPFSTNPTTTPFFHPPSSLHSCSSSKPRYPQVLQSITSMTIFPLAGGCRWRWVHNSKSSFQVSQSAGFFTARKFVTFRRSTEQKNACVWLFACSSLTSFESIGVEPLLLAGRNVSRNCVGRIMLLASRLKTEDWQDLVSLLPYYIYIIEELGEFISQFTYLGVAELWRCFVSPSQGMHMPTVWTYTLFLVCFLAAEVLKVFIADFAWWLASMLMELLEAPSPCSSVTEVGKNLTNKIYAASCKNYLLSNFWVMHWLKK